MHHHTPSYAAEIVSSTEDPDRLRAVFQSLRGRCDPFPSSEKVTSLMPVPDPLVGRAEPQGAHHACLIIGSPKTLSKSTSSVLGNALLERLKERGWETESLTLTASLCMVPGQSALLAALERADLLLFAFPLYVDALPFLMTKALEVIAAHRQTADHPRSQRLFAIANSGFAEASQNHLALSICQRFAAENGMTWVGGLAMGAGEALCGGQKLQPMMASGLSCAHVIQALETTGAALAEAQTVPPEAVREIAKTPIPDTPSSGWREIFAHLANQMWERRAAEHGVSRQCMLAQPYEVARTHSCGTASRDMEETP